METVTRLSNELATASDSFITAIKKVSTNLDFDQFMEMLYGDQEELVILKEKELSLSWGNTHLRDFLHMKHDFTSWFLDTEEVNRVKFISYVESQIRESHFNN